MIKMKRKELCYLLICVMLCRPLLVFATGDQTKASAQTEVQEAGRSGADSTLGGLTAGAELVGSGADLGDLGAVGDARGSTEPPAGRTLIRKIFRSAQTGGPAAPAFLFFPLCITIYGVSTFFIYIYGENNTINYKLLQFCYQTYKTFKI